MTEHRFRRYPFTVDLLALMFTAGHTIHVMVREGIPAGARLAWHYGPDENGIVTLVMEHESFDVVPGSSVIPLGTVVMQEAGHYWRYAPLEKPTQDGLYLVTYVSSLCTVLDYALKEWRNGFWRDEDGQIESNHPHHWMPLPAFPTWAREA